MSGWQFSAPVCLRTLLISPKRNRRQTIFVEQIRPAPVARPRVTDGNWLRDGGTGDDDRSPINYCVGPVVLLVGTGESEALEFVARLEGQPLTGMGIADSDFGAIDFVGGIERPIIFDLLAINETERHIRRAVAVPRFIGRMNAGPSLYWSTS